MMASDVINSDHNLPELSCGGFAQKSSLWNLYGYEWVVRAVMILIVTIIISYL